MEIKRFAVYKLGTETITNNSGLDMGLMADLACQFVDVQRKLETGIIIVSSGSIYNGRRIISALNAKVIEDKQTVFPETVIKQTAAMFGQPELMDAWKQAFAAQKAVVGEALLKDEDIDNFKKPAMLASKFGFVIVNGPDATYDPATEEQIISIDNDRLARCVARTIGADTLGYLTQAEGILDKDRQLINEIRTLSDLERIGFFEKTVNGTGGPYSKILEARKALINPEMAVYIAGARTEKVIIRIANGEKVGTRVTLPLQGFLM